MIGKDESIRVDSFFNVYRKIVDNEFSGIVFTSVEKGTYQRFANSLITIISNFKNNIEYIKDIDLIINSLQNLYNDSRLETEIQNPVLLLRCFLKGDYSYYPNKTVSCKALKDFLTLLKASSSGKKKIILNNLWQRFDTVERKREEPIDDLPF